MSESALSDGVYLAFFFAAVHACFAVLLFVRRRHTRRQSPLERRSRRFVPSLLLYGVWVGALWAAYRAGAFNAESVGVSARVSPLVAFATGVGEYFLVRYVLALVLGAFGLTARVWAAVLRANASARPRNPLELLGVTILVVLVNPVTEELMTRGLLVHQWAALGAPVWLTITVGAVVNAINHAYQGRTLAPVHLMLYAATVAILYSPIGLFGAIGFHFAADAAAFAGSRKSLLQYREFRRQQRKTARQSAARPQHSRR